jgi:hypothetical protein
MQVETYSENRAQAGDFITTKYCGKDVRYINTSGEAYFRNDQWYYRPFNEEGIEFVVVKPKELECASDKGWLKGDYVGTKDLPKKGKAYWVDGCWNYKPNGTQKEYRIPEGKFIPVRDLDIY